MAQDSQPNFRVNVYGNDPQRLEDLERGMSMPGGGTGGIPWFPRSNSAYRNPAPVEPYKPAVGAKPPDVGAEQTGGSGGGGFLGLDPATLISLIMAGGSTIGGLFSGRNNNQGISSQTSDPAIQAMIQAQIGRMNKSEPLYDAILKMAGGLMPTQYQPTGSGAASAPPAGGVPTGPTNPFQR